MYRKETGARLRHDGISYLNFMATLSQQLRCRDYFESGTVAGHSLRAFRCDAVCVDPRFKISQDVRQGRRRSEHSARMQPRARIPAYPGPATCGAGCRSCRNTGRNCDCGPSGLIA